MGENQKSESENPYQSPLAVDKVSRAKPKLTLIPATLFGLGVFVLMVSAGLIIGLLLSLEANIVERLDRCSFFGLAGAIVGLGTGYLTTRILMKGQRLRIVAPIVGLLGIPMCVSNDPNGGVALRSIGAMLSFGALLMAITVLYARRFGGVPNDSTKRKSA